MPKKNEKFKIVNIVNLIAALLIVTQMNLMRV